MANKNRILSAVGSRQSALSTQHSALQCCLLLTACCLPPTAYGQQVHRNGFETRETAWSKGAADAPYRETAHALTDQTAHSGQLSEHLQLTAEQGGYIHYFYPLGRAPISDELSASLWIKSNRPGVQLLARVVLPRERDPNNLDDRLTTLIRGNQYQLAGRWQRLEIRRPVKLATEQQQLMRAELKREVDFADAYIDRLMLNVYGGPGLTEVWIDDLEASPVMENSEIRDQASGITPQGPGIRDQAVVPHSAVIELNQDRLLVDGKPFFFHGIRHSDTPLKTLRDAGFDTVWVDYQTSPALLKEAVNLGFWLVPSLPVTAPEAHGSQPVGLEGELTRFLAGDAVLFWYLGGGLVEEQKDVVSRAARAIKTADSQRPLAANVWDGFRPYSRSLDLIGVHRWPLMTSLELPKYRDWLNQRRLLAQPRSTFMWTWVQTHLPDWYIELVYGDSQQSHGAQSVGLGFSEPIGPQPEQIRLLSYIALSAGCRGLGFWSDRFLADSHQGRDRLLALALLNQEIQILEPLLMTADQPRWIDTQQPEVKAALLRSDRGLLVLPIWLGKGAQYVPGQSATRQLKMVVPEVPAGAQAWEVSPAEVRSLATERVVGGTQVTVPEFGLTQAIVFTTDNTGDHSLLAHFQLQARRMRKMAAQWNHDLAQVELDKVTRVEEQLEQAGHTLPDGKALLDNARSRLRTCEELWQSGDFSQAYAEAERAMRPLRILMRAQWEQALRGLDTPVASPYAVSFYTLPRHWRFMEQVLSPQTAPGANLLPEGDFELPAGWPSQGWSPQEATLDDLELTALRVNDVAHGAPKQGKQCLMLEIKPKNAVRANGKQPLPPAALERTFLAINSPSVRLPPRTLVRISGWVRIPGPITASADGALFYDSIGGEPLAVRLSNAMNWKQFTLYRLVPASGTVNVTLALTGLGKVYFDDIRIEPLMPGTTVASPGTPPLLTPGTAGTVSRRQ